MICNNWGILFLNAQALGGIPLCLIIVRFATDFRTYRPSAHNAILMRLIMVDLTTIWDPIPLIGY
jgi:hypothetical protein